MAAKTNVSPAQTADREMVFRRLFDAPREMVFEAWTNPKHLAQWWGPKGFTTTVHEMDVRPGGVWRLTMRGPDGKDYHNRIVFLEVEPPERLVYQHDPEPGSEPISFEVTVTMAEREGKTQVTMHMVFPSAASRNHVAKQHGAVEGGIQTLERLAQNLSAITGRPIAALPELRLERILNAPRETVFAAWTEEARLKRWWGPKGFTNPVCEFNARPGGAIRIHMQAPNGVVYPMNGIVNLVDPPARLAFISGALDADGKQLFEIWNSVTFEEHEGKTKQTLFAKVLWTTAQGAPYLVGMEMGWTLSLERLEQLVGQAILPAAGF